MSVPTNKIELLKEFQSFWHKMAGHAFNCAVKHFDMRHDSDVAVIIFGQSLQHYRTAKFNIERIQRKIDRLS